MTLEVIIIIIILIPILVLVFVRKKKDGVKNLPRLLCRITGNFLLVCGILLMFPAFYMLFHGKGGKTDAILLAVSLLMVAGGYIMTNRTDRKEKAD